MLVSVRRFGHTKGDCTSRGKLTNITKQGNYLSDGGHWIHSFWLHKVASWMSKRANSYAYWILRIVVYCLGMCMIYFEKYICFVVWVVCSGLLFWHLLLFWLSVVMILFLLVCGFGFAMLLFLLWCVAALVLLFVFGQLGWFCKMGWQNSNYFCPASGFLLGTFAWVWTWWRSGKFATKTRRTI